MRFKVWNAVHATRDSVESPEQYESVCVGGLNGRHTHTHTRKAIVRLTKKERVALMVALVMQNVKHTLSHVRCNLLLVCFD